VWSGLVLVQVPVTAILGVTAACWANQVRQLPLDDDRPLWQVMAAWLSAIVAGGILLQAQAIAMRLDYPRNYRDSQHLRTIALSTVFAVVTAVPAVALWGVSRAAAAIRPADPGAIDRFSRLWSLHRAFLGVLSSCSPW
jgi:hypothetical protein